MKYYWQQLHTQLKGIEEISSIPAEYYITGVGDVSTLVGQKLVFVANNKFLQRLQSRYTDKPFSQCLIVFSTELFQSLSSDHLLLTSDNFFVHGKNLPFLMCQLSKLLFEEEKLHFNDLVDGRQMGTVDIDPSADIAQNVFIGKGVKIARDVKIAPGCCLQSFSSVGEGSVLQPNVTLYPKTKIGKECIIHAGTVLGSDGYGFNFIDGKHEKIWHLGHVEIEDNVEIGANCSIDRGTFGVTRIGQGAKLDNLVHVAHNVEVGDYSLLCGQVGIAGSTKIGNYCVFGGQVGITNDVTIGAKTQVGGGGIVTSHLAEKSTVAGHPARPVKEWLKGIALLRKMSQKK